MNTIRRLTAGRHVPAALRIVLTDWADACSDKSGRFRSGGRLYSRILVISFAISLFAPFLRCQSAPAPEPVLQTNNAVPHADKHILGIIPNFRTAALPVPYQPILS